MSRDCQKRAEPSFPEATVTAVGRPLATSSAKLGPERTDRGHGEEFPHDLADPLPRVDLDALGHVADLRPVGAEGLQGGEEPPERLGGEGQDPVVGMQGGLRDVRCG